MVGKSTRSVYLVTVGIAVGALLAGLVFPLAVGDRLGTTLTSGAPSAGGATGAGVTVSDDAPTAGGAGRPTVATGVATGAGGVSGAAPANGSPTGAPGASTRRAAPGAAPAGSTEQGVSATEVTVVALLFDLGGVGRSGFAAPGADAANQRRYYEAYFADVNESAAAGGRRVKPVFISFDPLNSDDARRACLAATEDTKAFAVLSTGAFSGDDVLCVTEEHGVPLIAGLSEADEYFRRSRGLLFTPKISSTRMGRVQVQLAHQQDRLARATIGIVSDEAAAARLAVDNAMVPELRRLGYPVAHVTRLSPDTQVAASQMPVEIAEMRRKGVDTVLTASNPVYMATWFNQADGAQYRPRYILSDIAQASNDFTVQAAPASLDAIAYTGMRFGEERTNRPVQPETAACAERYRKRTGETVAPTSSGFIQLMGICGTVDLFARAVSAATPAGLTRGRFSEAIRSFGSFAFPHIGGTISFGPNKFDGVDFVRTKRYDSACRCFIPVDEFQPLD